MTRDEIKRQVSELVSGYDMEPEDAIALYEIGKLAAETPSDAAEQAHRAMAHTYSTWRTAMRARLTAAIQERDVAQAAAERLSDDLVRAKTPAPADLVALQQRLKRANQAVQSLTLTERGTLAPHPKDSQEYLRALEAMLEWTPAVPVDTRPARHGYGCENDGDDMAEGVNCPNCCRHGWVESAQGKPCPRCYPAPLAASVDTPPRVTPDVAGMRAAIQQWAIYCFNHHGDDANLYNGLAELGGVDLDGKGWIPPAPPQPAGEMPDCDCDHPDTGIHTDTCAWLAWRRGLAATSTPRAGEMPAIEVGDWVHYDASSLVDSVDNDHDVREWQKALPDIDEIRGTRHGQPFVWRRDRDPQEGR